MTNYSHPKFNTPFQNPNFRNSWEDILSDELKKEYFIKLSEFLSKEYLTKKVFPSPDNVFNALKYTDYSNVKVVILGQDPYHDENQAHGLSFSVKPGIKLPPSLRNIFKELNHDLGCYIPNNGYLKKWADQGVLLLNTVLTVRAHEANSHKGIGWEIFTDKIICSLNEHKSPIIFILWGNNAISKKKLITNERHFIIQSVHPSPLSASRGFFDSKPFSKANDFLTSVGKSKIDWQIENNKEPL